MVNKIVFGEKKTETPKMFWIDELCSIGAKICSIVCYNGEKNKSKLKGVAKASKMISSKDYYICSKGKNMKNM